MKDMEDIKKLLIPEVELKSKIIELAYKIADDYSFNENLVVIIVMDGAMIFASDLLRHLSYARVFPFIHSIYSKSYSGTESGQIGIISFINKKDIENKDVLVVEDIYDTGKTLNNIDNILRQCDPKSIEYCVLLKKIRNREYNNINIKYFGFQIENTFVIGYGLDYNGKYRNLQGIYKIIKNK